ncbi:MULTISPECIES: metal-dependent transcriptional regulator [Myroides]|uniref:Transcriptional regulator MntR n=1 Tax=Myroides albus TaxID=2562892 RepID=A0A6I3LH67_9FLAO|nr:MULTISPECIES: metal-dependent transcriptional regulator [Myroides]MTG97573.1 metal-dependent transcriptional regulator [Myroides albus]MVX36110.1 metal-dependent transcriptional regulator [Myroides sp. LoEW2-1]UVD81152.1 metal-dependent transcriptional regulator [Myroides albus]
MLTYSEENYLKTIFHLSLGQQQGISTNAIAAKIETKASSVTDMIKKLNEKKLIKYQKYQGVTLTAEGLLAAKMIVRKHRLWEVFLVDKLGFSWDEVHDVAEELEHIKSEKLINKLDAFLEYPTQDPHGDPIPNAKGEIKQVDKKLLSEVETNKIVICVGVKDSSSEFLQYLDKQKISLGSKIEITDIEPFDQSYTVKIDNHNITITKKIASNLFVKEQ